jgi:dihydroorotate dehydrogenase electron transfer subunit
MKTRVCAKLVAVKPIDHETFIHTYEAPEIAKDAKPGQFLHIRVSHLSAPLLRRPISLLWSDGQKNVQVLFKRVRTGTALLSEKRTGETVDLVGPLGHEFTYDFSRDAVMIAGGYGIAPLYYLAKLNRSNHTRTTLIYGARSADLLYLKDELRQIFNEVIYTTEDGSLGQRGRVTDPLRDLLVSRTNFTVYGCGPTPMLAAIQRTVEEAPEQGVPCWVSMENQMGCGIGACLGCVIKTKDGYKTTCKAGPIFNGYEVVFS